MCSTFRIFPRTFEYTPHRYVMPYLQNADHMQFQIPAVNYPHYHNHLDTHTAGKQASWQPVHKAEQRLKLLWGRLIGCVVTPLTIV